jgi:hypothetical protein
MSNGVSGVMNALRAEELLKDSELFAKIDKLCADLQYNTQETRFAFDDYFQSLVEAIDAIPKLELDNDVAPGTETLYTIQLTQSAEQIVDECDRLYRRLNQFAGKLREAERKIENLRAEFVAWYMVSASILLGDLEDVKLPQTEVRKLAESQFSRLMHNMDVALTTMIEAVKIEVQKVNHHKTAQKEKYEYGQDQANASYASTLPAFGNAFAEERGSTSVVEQDDEEDVPQQIKEKPSIIGDALRILTPSEPKGTFVKHGDAKPVTPVVNDDAPTPRRKLIEEEE